MAKLKQVAWRLISLLSVALLALGCRAKPDLDREIILPQNSTELVWALKQEIGVELPIGSPRDDVERLLSAAGVSYRGYAAQSEISAEFMCQGRGYRSKCSFLISAEGDVALPEGRYLVRLFFDEQKALACGSIESYNLP